MPEKPRAKLFQTQSEIRVLLDSAGLAPRRRLGQCFLIDRNLMLKLVEAAELGDDDRVLEVGCGTGSLTGLLAERAGRVVAVEIDRGLAEIARNRLADRPNVAILACDVLRRKSEIEPQVLDALTAAWGEGPGRMKLVANLPYDVATSLVMNLLLASPRFDRLCFTVQSEVGDRFLAEADTAAYGPVSILCGLLTDAMRIARAPARAFWPAPRVSSVMLRLDVKSAPALGPAQIAGFAELVRRSFQSRRKTLGHIGRQLGLTGFDEALETVSIPGQSRPASLAIDQWVALYKAVSGAAAAAWPEAGQAAVRRR